MPSWSPFRRPSSASRDYVTYTIRTTSSSDNRRSGSYRPSHYLSGVGHVSGSPSSGYPSRFGYPGHSGFSGYSDYSSGSGSSAGARYSYAPTGAYSNYYGSRYHATAEPWTPPPKGSHAGHAGHAGHTYHYAARDSRNRDTRDVRDGRNTRNTRDARDARDRSHSYTPRPATPKQVRFASRVDYHAAPSRHSDADQSDSDGDRRYHYPYNRSGRRDRDHGDRHDRHDRHNHKHDRHDDIPFAAVHRRTSSRATGVDVEEIQRRARKQSRSERR